MPSTLYTLAWIITKRNNGRVIRVQCISTNRSSKSIIFFFVFCFRFCFLKPVLCCSTNMSLKAIYCDSALLALRFSFSPQIQARHETVCQTIQCECEHVLCMQCAQAHTTQYYNILRDLKKKTYELYAQTDTYEASIVIYK